MSIAGRTNYNLLNTNAPREVMQSFDVNRAFQQGQNTALNQQAARQTNQTNALQLQAEQQKQQKQMAIKNALATAGADKKKAVMLVGQIDPVLGAKMQKAVQDEQAAKIKQMDDAMGLQQKVAHEISQAPDATIYETAKAKIMEVSQLLGQDPTQALAELEALNAQGPEAIRQDAMDDALTASQHLAQKNFDNKNEQAQKNFNRTAGQRDQQLAISKANSEKAATDEEMALAPDGSLTTGGFHYTADMLKNYAETYEKLGKLPSLGMKAGPLRKAIMYYHGLNVTKQGKSGYEVAGGWAETKAQSASLVKQKANVDFADAFMNNMHGQVPKIKGLLANVLQLDTRLANIPIRKWEESVIGETNRAQIKLWMGELTAEIGRLSQGNPQSIAELSSTASEKWENIMDLNLPAGSLVDLLDTTIVAGKLRKKSLTDRYNKTLQEALSPGSKKAVEAKKVFADMTDEELLKHYSEEAD